MLRTKLSIALLLALFSFNEILSQTFLGYNTSNYSGIHGVIYNPASIADSRHKFDINLGGFSVGAYNNYIGMDGTIFSQEWKKLRQDKFSSNTSAFSTVDETSLIERDNNKLKSIYANVDLHLPSFFITINEKNAIGFNWRVRTIANVDGLEPELAKLIYNELEYPSLWVQKLENKSLSVQAMTWAEYNLTYAHVFIDENENFLKAGGSLKFLQGLGAAYMFIDNLRYEFTNDDTLSLFSSDVRYGHSNNFELDANNIDYKLVSKLGIGLDLGVVYERRTNYKDYKYDMDGETDLWRRDQNKYKYKLGLAITDIGGIKFDKGELSNDFHADVSLWDINNLDFKTVREFDDTLRNRFVSLNDDERTFRMALPTAFSLQFDYNIWKNFYVNSTAFLALQFKKDLNKVHEQTTISITPRWDTKYLGVFVPVSYNQMGNTQVGLGLRLGELIIGTSNITPLVSKADIFGADFYAALKFGLPHFKPRDMDNDKVSDKMDICKEVPGVWAFKGCPDTDEDGIQDSEDKCPLVPGLKEFEGCPDTDGDGIPDTEDECIDIPGLKVFNGCPDTDGDGIEDRKDDCPELPGPEMYNGCPDTDGDSIIDPDDACPDVPGPRKYNGCPDTDGDGLLDYIDECPEVAGPKENSGCPWPDTDGDGILDREDKCPNNPGPKENQGCPYTDTDGDGVLDKDDDCPNVPGVVELKGCPKIEEEEKEVLKTAFDNLEFQTGKAIILAESYESLNKLAELLVVKRPEWKLRLEGHTDNVGNDQNNLILSKKRSEAVKQYLIDRGVAAERIKAEYYGEMRPVADNDTEEGRQRNRRVEMEIEFE